MRCETGTGLVGEETVLKFFDYNDVNDVEYVDYCDGVVVDD